jgi:predicted TPR repeat methyltransferase
MSSIQKVVRSAMAQMGDMTGLVGDNVSSLAKADSGWKLVVNMVELKRIPPSTDMLASFDVSVDGDGNVINYQRTRRYLRDQVLEEDES